MNPIVFLVLAAVLIGVAFYLVALPLIQRARRNAPSFEPVTSEEERLGELLAQRDAAFQALRELNFDHRVGKVTDEDFVAFEATLKQNAAETLRALDRWEAESDDELDIAMEQAVRSRRVELTAQTSKPDGRTCSKCGAQASEGDKFCAKCGSPLTKPAKPAPLQVAATLACPSCGKPYEAGDKFCPRCGQTLTAEIAPAAR